MDIDEAYAREEGRICDDPNLTEEEKGEEIRALQESARGEYEAQEQRAREDDFRRY